MEKSEKLKGIVNFAFVNCETDRSFCQKHAPKNLPKLKLYPPVPIPSQEYDLDLRKVINQAVKYVKNYVKVLKEDDM